MSRGVVVAILATFLTPVAGQPAANAIAETYRRPANGVFQFEGHGWGHGHGMSQWGAQGAATLGKTWQQIVGFYYPHTTVVQVPAAADTVRVWLSGDDEVDLRVPPASGLTVTDPATGATAALPAITGVDMWRISQTVDAQHLEERLNGVWRPYPVNGVTDFAGPMQFSRPATGWLTVALAGDAPHNYRGVVRAVRTSPSTMDTVNVLSMDAYLKGVVPHESPSSFKPEALKAQAVAARTYAAYDRLANAKKFYDICDSTSCQVYGGMTGEATSTNAAVDATTGQTIMYGGKPAFTEFNSSNGGWSTDGGQPYLVAQADPWDGAVANSVHTWTGQITAAQIEAAYPAVGHLTAITVLTRDGNGEWGGRVLNVQLTGVGTGGAATAVNVTGRSIFLVRQWPTYQSPDGLRSSWWHITNVDAQLVAVDPAPALVATTAVQGRATLTARYLVQGTETFPGSTLSLVPDPTAPAAPAGLAPAAGRFTRNVTRPGSATVAPGDTIEMALDVNAAQVAPGSYALDYRLSNGSAAIGDPVTWRVTVKAAAVTAVVVGMTAVGSPPAAAGGTVVVPVKGAQTVVVTVRNTGNVSWPLDRSVVVATSPAGRASASTGPTWLSPDTPAAIAARGLTAVAPGQTATVTLPLFGNAGAYGATSEAFRLTWTGTGAGAGPRDVTGGAFTLTLRRTDPAVGLGRLPAGLSAYLDRARNVVISASGTDGRGELRAQGATAWTPASSLGGPVLGRVTSVRTDAGVIVSVARGLDGKVWVRSSTTRTWVPGALAVLDEPGAAALPGGRVQLLARGTDGTVLTAVWSPTAGVGGWSRIGTTVFASGVSAVYSAAGVLVAAVAKDGSVSVNRLVAGRWTGWTVVGQGASDAAPALTAVPGSAAAYLVVRGTDGRLRAWTRSAAGAWGRQFSLGGPVASGPAAVALGATNVMVFARWADGSVHYRRLGASGWQGWVLAF
ncbi:MAG: stage sporulation protein [Frankiaceae bacterium]|nr:stage sporulation protein [Frankiaceae bacterium]